MTPQEAADLVRSKWHNEPPPLSPEEQHYTLYLMSVCQALGLAPDPINCAHVGNMLAQANVPKHTGDEYPKALFTTDKLGRPVEVRYPAGHEKNGLPVVFENAEEEAGFSSHPVEFHSGVPVEE